MALLAGSTVLAQGVALATAPILTRIYSVDAFGIYGLYISILSILSVVSSLRYEFAIPIPEDDVEAADLLILSLTLVAALGGALCLVLYFFRNGIAVSTGIPEFARYWWLVAVAFIVAGIYTALMYWATRAKAFKPIARTKVTKNVATVIGQTILGTMITGAAGLIIGDLIGRANGTGLLSRLTREDLRAKWTKPTAARLWSTAIKHWRYPILTTPSSILNSASLNLPNLLIAAWFGTTVLGWFSLATRVLQLPITLLGQAVAQVFFSHASDAKRSGNLATEVRQVYIHLVTVGSAPFLLLCVAGGDLFGWLFGADWIMAGTYTQWLAPWLFLFFVSSPITTTVLVVERQREELLFQLTTLAVRIGSLWLGLQASSSMLAIQLFSISSACMRLLYTGWLLHISGVAIRSAILYAAKELSVAGLIISPFILAESLDLGDAATIFIALSMLVTIAGRIGWYAWNLKSPDSPVPHQPPDRSPIPHRN